MKKRFEVIQNIPSPYRLHLFREMWRQLASIGVDFHVDFMSEGHSERPDSWRNPPIEFPHQYWKDYGFRTHHFNPGLIAYIRQCAPDYLLVGSPFDTFTSIIASWMCSANSRTNAWRQGFVQTDCLIEVSYCWRARFGRGEIFCDASGIDEAKNASSHNVA